jgi:hypothetical protein
MVAAVLCFSRNKLAPLGGLMLLLAGCATAAPDLPTDTTSVNRKQSVTLDSFSAEDRALSCDQIADERARTVAAREEAVGKIEGNRTRNQVAGYLGSAVALPIWLATDQNDAEKQQIVALYQRQDALSKLAVAKGCPTQP